MKHWMSGYRRWSTLLCVGLLAVVRGAGPAAAAGLVPPLAVVELFTSEGCSSCPPAEAFLRELAPRPSVLALEFHVDYWDYLGWKDPFASPAHTARQRAYAAQVSGGQIYTPQMIINGRVDVIGSRRDAVEGILRQSASLSVQPVIRSEGPSGYSVTVPAGAEAADGPALTVWQVVYDLRQDVAVGRGENSGRRLVHAHVVRSLTPVGTWSGPEVTLPLTPPEAGQGVAVLVQAGPGAPVVGATRWEP